MVIGFTGTAQGMTADQLATVQEAVIAFPTVEAHHGGGGDADFEFHRICLSLRIPVHVHPPLAAADDAKYEGAAEVHPARSDEERRREIVNSTGMLIAAPDSATEQPGSGTWAAVRYAREQGHHVWIVLPDGEIVVEDN